jgi:hypothetical protein
MEELSHFKANKNNLQMSDTLIEGHSVSQKKNTKKGFYCLFSSYRDLLLSLTESIFQHTLEVMTVSSNMMLYSCTEIQRCLRWQVYCRTLVQSIQFLILHFSSASCSCAQRSKYSLPGHLFSDTVNFGFYP